MLDSSTAYLILAMAAFGMMTLLLIHLHKTSEKIRAKRIAVERIVEQIDMKSDAMELEINEMRDKIDAIDEEMQSRKG